MSEQRETILVVDDDREIVGAIAAALEKEDPPALLLQGRRDGPHDLPVVGNFSAPGRA